MTPVAPCSPSNISFIPGTSFTTRKNRSFSRYSYAGQPAKQSLSSKRFFITLSRSNTLFPQLRNGHPSLHLSRIKRVSAIGTDVADEVQNIHVSDEAVTQEVETNGEASTKSDVSNAPTREKKRRGRKSEMPPVKDEDLIPGAIFTGKVRSIQPFGAFVDFGAFTDGLVHLSRLSESFVKDVNDVVSLGQEVKVRLVEVNTETGRISLSMRDDDGSNDSQNKTDKPRSPRKSASKEVAQKKQEFKKTSKFIKGQDLVGTVKNFGRSGAFISLPEGEEGFLPTSEEPDDGFGNIMGQTSLEVGQEVKVRVLRIARGIMTLTMKKEEDVKKLESKLNQGVVHTATNPFFVAFRRNKDVAAFLDEREKIEEPAGIEVEEIIKQANSSDSEESSVSNVSQSLDVASLITEEEDTYSKIQDDTPILDDGGDINETSSISAELSEETQTENSDVREEVPEEFPTVEAKEETSTPEGNGSITS